MSDPVERLVAGRYRLRRLIGQGSMGTVWEAYDEVLHRPVAVKEVLLPPGMPQHEADELRERTLREARAIAVVSHSNVITLHDVAREHGEPFVVMEYLPSASLAQLLAMNGPLDQPQAAAIGNAVAAGLQAAHHAGITHRDVKPGNVLVADDGRVKLTDFGIARNMSEHTLTQTGIMLGSPAYIAPEVASGGAVTPAADLWGLGATLFAAVDGRPPYDPDGPILETLQQVVNGVVPRPSTTGPIADVIGALMVKDPTERIPLGEVRRLLHPLLPAHGTSPFATLRLRPPEPPPPPAPPEERPTVVVSAPRPAAPPTAVPSSSGGGQLAADPGPLPFGPRPASGSAPAPASRRGGRRLAAALLVVLAVVLFAAAAAGGFALTRVVGGASIAPPSRPDDGDAPAAPLRGLVTRDGDAATVAGTQGGTFTVPVPSDWPRFVEERATRGLPSSTRVHWVSPDGRQELAVERFPSLYPKGGIRSYLATLKTQWASAYKLVSQTDVTLSLPAGAEPAQQITYRTTDTYRVTFADLVPVGTDLWVVSVTVPIDEEDSSRVALFDKIAPEFRLQ